MTDDIIAHYQRLLSSFCQQNAIGLVCLRPYDHDGFAVEGDIDVLVDKGHVSRLVTWMQSLHIDVYARQNMPDVTRLYVHYALEDGRRLNIQLDCVHRLQVGGIDYLNANDVIIRRRVDADGIAYADAVDQVVILGVTSLLKHGVAIKPRYHGYCLRYFKENETALHDYGVRILGARHGTEFLYHLRDNLPYRSRGVMMAYVYHAWLRMGFDMWERAVLYRLRRLVYRLRPKTVLIRFAGVDGAGKTSLVKTLLNVPQARLLNIDYVHFMPSWPWARREMRIVSDGVDPDPHRHAPRHVCVAAAKMVYYAVRYWLFVLWPRQDMTVVLFDRYIDDMVIDPTRFRVPWSDAVSRRWCRLMPRPALTVYVDIDAQAAQARKQEISYAETARQILRYREEEQDTALSVRVSGTAPLSEGVQNVMAAIRSLLSSR